MGQFIASEKNILKKLLGWGWRVYKEEYKNVDKAYKPLWLKKYNQQK